MLCICYVMIPPFPPEDYLREANSQLKDKNEYREVKCDAEGSLMKV